MKTKCIFVWLATALCVASADARFIVENKFIGSVLSTEDGALRTVEIVNKRAGTLAKPETQFVLTAADLKVVKSEKMKGSRGRRTCSARFAARACTAATRRRRRSMATPRGTKRRATSAFTVESAIRVDVEGAGGADIKTDGTLDIEGLYIGRKRSDERKN